jgi:hypothetical protein
VIALRFLYANEPLGCLAQGRPLQAQSCLLNCHREACHRDVLLGWLLPIRFKADQPLLQLPRAYLVQAMDQFLQFLWVSFLDGAAALGVVGNSPSLCDRDGIP